MTTWWQTHTQTRTHTTFWCFFAIHAVRDFSSRWVLAFGGRVFWIWVLPHKCHCNMQVFDDPWGPVWLSFDMLPMGKNAIVYKIDFSCFRDSTQLDGIFSYYSMMLSCWNIASRAFKKKKKTIIDYWRKDPDEQCTILKFLAQNVKLQAWHVTLMCFLILM